jgi:hypothetical protein
MFFAFSVRAALIALVLVAVGCERKVPPWERADLQVEVTVRGPDLDLTGRLTFTRPRGAVGTLQLDVTRETHLDNATLLASGKTTAFTDGVPRAITPREARALAVLAALVAWPGAAGERHAAPSGARVRMPEGGEYHVTLGEEAPRQGHHGMR